MNYHPLMGITFFFIVLIVAFILGRRIPIKKDDKGKIIIFKRKKTFKSDSIAPDANWID